MRVIAAYLLLKLGGTANPTAADIKKVLAAAGIEGDEGRITAFLKEVDGKDVYQLMKDGREKLAKFGGGGGGGGGAAPAQAAGGAAPAAKKEEKAPEPAKKEESEEEEMELDLFG